MTNTRADGEGKCAKDSYDERTPLTKVADAKATPSLLWAPRQWLRSLVETYSARLLVMVVCTNHVLKGFVAGGGDGGLLGTPMEFLFKPLGVDGGQMQVYMAVAISPWALKPLIGFFSDAFPICGYQKIPYMAMASVGGLVATALLGVEALHLRVSALVVCLFCAFLYVAVVDLLVDAKQSAEIRHSSDLGPDFFLFTWLGIVIGMILAALVVGTVIQYSSAHVCYLIALPFMLLSIWPIAMNYLGEKALPEEQRSGRLVAVFSQHPEICTIALAMGVAIMSILVVTLTAGKDSEFVQVYVAVGAAFVLLSAFIICIRWEVAGPMAFWFFLQACPKIDGALFYFYTDGPHEFPGGPNFSPWLYATGMSLASFTGVLCGYLTGAGLFKTWRYTGILCLTVPLRVVVRLCLLPVLWRWTTTRRGNSDAAWVLPIEFLGSMIYAWGWIPKQVMSAHMTVNGYEATMLALMAGMFNMGGMIASYLGCLALSKFNVCADGDGGDAAVFPDIWKPYLISVLAPLATMPLLPFTIPFKLQTEVLITDHPSSTTYGSPLWRLRARASDDAPQP